VHGLSSSRLLVRPCVAFEGLSVGVIPSAAARCRPRRQCQLYAFRVGWGAYYIMSREKELCTVRPGGL
jgi:hypothetical protein